MVRDNNGRINIKYEVPACGRQAKYGIVKHLKLFSLGKQLKVVADLQNSIKNQRF
jgi:hypothetical protein